MRIEDHPAVFHVEEDTDGTLHVDVDSTRSHVISRVITTVMDAGHVPREIRQHHYGIRLVLAQSVDELPANDENVLLAR